MMYQNFRHAIEDINRRFKTSATRVSSKKWQSIDITKKPEMAMFELLDFMMQIPLSHENLERYREDIEPNVPWADLHFEQERASGRPINPGETWKIWPWGHSAGNFLNSEGQFSHSYAERYWPKKGIEDKDGVPSVHAKHGMRFNYGDLRDVVNLLASDPNTRQAVLPVWFPEDTGVVHGERVPCSISYVFNQRNGYFHIFYHIRSCDFVRHFQDDCYLTIRLALWILQELRKIDAEWENVALGRYTMVINSLHMFANDYHKRFPSHS